MSSGKLPRYRVQHLPNGATLTEMEFPETSAMTVARLLRNEREGFIENRRAANPKLTDNELADLWCADLKTRLSRDPFR